MERGSGEDYQSWRADTGDAKPAPRGARRRKGNKPDDTKHPSGDESEVLSVGETIVQEQAAEQPTSPAPAAEGSLPEETPVVPAELPIGSVEVLPEQVVVPPPPSEPTTENPTPVEADFAVESSEVETPASGPERLESSVLAWSRWGYAKALRSQSKILFGRTSKTNLDGWREAYQAEIAAEVQKKIQEVKAEFSDIQTDSARETELNAQITEIILTNKSEEENKLVMEMRGGVENGAAEKFRQFWKKHTKARLAIGMGLIGAQFALPGAASEIQSMRAIMGGLGTTLSVDSLMEMARSKFGKTATLKPEQDMKSINDAELMQRLAAHETSFVDRDAKEKEFGVRERGVAFFKLGKKWKDETGQRLRSEYQDRQKNNVQAQVSEYQHAGLSADEIVAKVLKASLQEQQAHHTALEQRRASDRRYSAISKVAATALGAAAGALSLFGALRHAQQATESGKDMAHVGSIMPAHDVAHPDAPPPPPPEVADVTVHPATTPADISHVAAPADTVSAHRAGLDISQVRHPDTIGVHGPETAAAVGAAETVEAKNMAVETVKKGDSVWKIVERQLHERMGEKFNGLDEARQTYMIDALKDRVVEHHADFGLPDPDHLSVGQHLDLSPLFEGPQAVDLGQVHEHALGLNQAAVENIIHNNELLREWVQAHPHEALNAENVLHATKTAIAEPSFSAHANQVLTEKLTSSMRERMLCDLADKYPEEYYKAHLENPTLYPDVAGTTAAEQTATAATVGQETAAHIHLGHHAFEAHQKYTGTMKWLYGNAPRPEADVMVSRINNMTVGEVMKQGALEKSIRHMEGGTPERAKKIAVAIHKFLKSIPAHEYVKSEKFKDLLGRVDIQPT